MGLVDIHVFLPVEVIKHPRYVGVNTKVRVAMRFVSCRLSLLKQEAAWLGSTIGKHTLHPESGW
jgi:hypothetical protein